MPRRCSVHGWYSQPCYQGGIRRIPCLVVTLIDCRKPRNRVREREVGDLGTEGREPVPLTSRGRRGWGGCVAFCERPIGGTRLDQMWRNVYIPAEKLINCIGGILGFFWLLKCLLD